MISFFSKEKRKAVKERKLAAQISLQADIDKANQIQAKRVEKHNKLLRANLAEISNRINISDTKEVKDYFRFVLSSDGFALNDDYFEINFALDYDSSKQRLVVDYRLPTTEDIPDTKEYKVSKQNEITPSKMKKNDYLSLYENSILDSSLRVVGLLFESDDRDVIKEVIFNGSCVYADWQSAPTVLVSFLIPKSKYNYQKVCKMDFLSKHFIASLNQVEYIGDIHSSKAPSELLKRSPAKRVVPIQSSI